jgi:hypothetical protein
MKLPRTLATIRWFTQDFALFGAIQQNNAPKDKSELAEIPRVTLLSCSHPIHPAYASEFGHTLCPNCRMMNSGVELSHSANVINVHGGVVL